MTGSVRRHAPPCPVPFLVGARRPSPVVGCITSDVCRVDHRGYSSAGSGPPACHTARPLTKATAYAGGNYRSGEAVWPEHEE